MNLKAAYGFNGLSSDPMGPSYSWDSAATKDFPSWSLGLEFNIPLGSNIKGRNYYKAAQLSMQEAYLNLKGTQNEIANSLGIAIQKAQAWRQSIQSYQTVVSYNEELLKTQLERLKAGAVEGAKVLENRGESVGFAAGFGRRAHAISPRVARSGIEQRHPLEKSR